MSRDGVATRVLGMVRRAIVRLVDDSDTVQRVQVEARAGETVPDVDCLQPYGLTGNPPVGARALVVNVGSAFDHVVALLAGHTDRPTGLGAGDVTLYCGHDARVDLRDDGTTVKGPRLKADGPVDAGGGFKKGGTPGASGTLVITIPAPPPAPPAPPLGVATVVVMGGIVTSVSGTGVCVWTPG